MPPVTKKERAPQGWGAVAKRQTAIAEAKERADGAIKDFWLADGESAVIQFLQPEPYCYDAHSIKDKKGKFMTVPCGLTTSRHCTLCSEGVKTTWKAAFMVLDFRGTWDTDKKRFKHDVQVPKIWKVGTTIAQQLKQQVDKRGKDLDELVFEVTRSGAGKDATYNFEIAFDSDDKKIKPVVFDMEEIPTVEDCCKPLTEDELDELGYTV